MTSDLTATNRSRPRRRAERGRFDRAEGNAIIDEAYVGHVGFVIGGLPHVLPMTFGRIDDVLYLHGAVGNAMLRASTDAEVCVTITLLDGLVLARSAFHHSMNYRCVVLFGTATRVDDPVEKHRAFDAIVEHTLRGRSAMARPSNDTEFRTTLVLALPIREGSVKIRADGASDEPEDVDLPVWAGVLPLRLEAGTPVQDPEQMATGPRGLPAPVFDRDPR